MTSDFSLKGISALAPRRGLFPFSPSCSQGDLPEPRTCARSVPDTSAKVYSVAPLS